MHRLKLPPTLVRAGALLLLSLFGLIAAQPARPPVAPEPERLAGIRTKPIRPGLYMLQGTEGNITVSIGDDGVLIVDPGKRDEAAAVWEAIQGLGGTRVDYVVDSHFHGDHTEANAFFRDLGAQVVAHRQARAMMLKDTWTPRSEPDLPTVLFDDTFSIHYNGLDVELRHIPFAHTNSDVVTVFHGANVVVAGDLLVNRGMPFISKGTGGSIDGYLRGQRDLLSACDRETVIVPGHGPLADVDDVARAQAMLGRVRGRVALLRTLRIPFEYVQKLPVLADWPADWRDAGIGSDHFLKIVYHSLPD